MWKRRQAPCADDQTTRLGHRFATGQKPATDPLALQAPVQTRHHKRSFGRFGTRNALQLATSDAAVPAGVGRPATARSSHVPGRPGRSIDHGPGRSRQRHAGTGRLAHRPCRHPPLRYQRGPGQKIFWLPCTCPRPSHACREMRADAVKFESSASSGSPAWMRAPRIRA